MIRTRLILAWLLTIGFVSAGTAMAAEKITVGNASTVVRTVTGIFDKDLRKIQMLDDLYHNELVETGDESATEITFLDDTRLAMGPESSMVLDRFVYDPDPSEASFIVTATQGVFRFATGKLPKKAYTIHTPNSTIGIRGTEFDLVVTPAKEGESETTVVISVKSGEATVTDCAGDTAVLDKSDSIALVSGQRDTGCVTETATGASTQDALKKNAP